MSVMLPIYKYIILLLLTSSSLSCNQTSRDQQLPRGKDVLKITEIFRSNNISTISSNRILLGNKFRITHDSYGCFNKNSRYIDVEVNERAYSVTLKDQFSNKAYLPVQFDSSFAILLKDFCNYYSRLLDSKDSAKPTNDIDLGTVNRLTISGGLGTTIIFCDNLSELSGFNNLVNRINLVIAE